MAEAKKRYKLSYDLETEVLTIARDEFYFEDGEIVHVTDDMDKIEELAWPEDAFELADAFEASCKPFFKREWIGVRKLIAFFLY